MEAIISLYLTNDLRMLFFDDYTVGGCKSMYIQALGGIVTMAQIGSFVPCTLANINICQ